jgi:hypothetical protein
MGSYHQPVEELDWKNDPGLDSSPSVRPNGTNIPPLPVRERLSERVVPTSVIVVLAHVDSMVVPVTTGFPDGSR